MLLQAQNEVCPKCQSAKLERLERAFWMRLLPESSFYLCEICGVHFLYLDSVPLVYGLGFFLISVGVFLIIFTLSADRLGFGYPGIGLAEKAGIVLGIVITFIGAIFALLVLTLTFKK